MAREGDVRCAIAWLRSPSNHSQCLARNYLHGHLSPPATRPRRAGPAPRRRVQPLAQESFSVTTRLNTGALVSEVALSIVK